MASCLVFTGRAVLRIHRVCITGRGAPLEYCGVVKARTLGVQRSAVPPRSLGVGDSCYSEKTLFFFYFFLFFCLPNPDVEVGDVAGCQMGTPLRAI